MTWGRDTDEHEARDQLTAFVEAGGNLLDTADVYADGDSEELLGCADRRRGPPRRRRPRDQGRRLPRTGTRVTDASRGPCSPPSTRRCGGSGVDHVDLWQVHTWVDDAPLEETLSALDTAVASGRASYVGVSNYSGWQTAQAATWQRAVPGPGAAGLDPGRVLAAAARRSSTRSCRRPRRSGSGCCRGRRSAAAC